MYRYLLFFLCLQAQFLMGSPIADEDSKFSEGLVPQWVNYCDFQLDPVPLKPSQVNLQFLLIDSQKNWEEKCAYFHYATKALTQAGVSNISKVDIDFDPSYQYVIVHGIRVFRDGKWEDRLHTARHSLLQQESELEFDLYDGVLTLVYFLEDICEGDIVEYAYSVIGALPYLSSHFTAKFNLQGSIAIERDYRRILMSPDHEIQVKSFNTQIEPQIRDLSPTLREWTWDLIDAPTIVYEEHCPDWYFPKARVQITEYRTWQEVIEKLCPFFTLSDDLTSNPSEEMMSLVRKWEDVTPDSAERAFFALRFVQEKIRYLGFEEGICGLQPNDPRIVFQRRFGDCKDKTFLLCTLLRLMGIDSTPVLVHSDSGHIIADSLPSISMFNHVILRIDLDGDSYFVDSTMHYQGGSTLKDNFFPSYQWGLPISKYSTGLIALPEISMKKPTEIETSFVLMSEESADLKITWTFYDSKADTARGYVENVGLKKISDGALKKIQKLYGKAAILSPIAFSDDRDKNSVKIVESYRIPTSNRSGKKILKVCSNVIRDFLESGINPERSAPYALYHPAWIKEHIHIENPFNDWGNDSENYIFEHESLFFTKSLKMEGQNADFHFELKTLKDHVPTQTLYDYWEITNEIEDHGLNIIHISTPERQSSN